MFDITAKTFPEELYEFAYFPDIFSSLDLLAQTAMPEPWRYKHPQTRAYNQTTPILEKYLRNVFKAHARMFNAASEAEEREKHFGFGEGWVCFHTGLVTPYRESIYAVFSTNAVPNRTTEWYFKGFWHESSRFMRNIRKLPERLNFAAEDLIFHPEWEIRINYRHIMEDNVLRLPEEIRAARNLPLILKGSTAYAQELAKVEPSIISPQYNPDGVQFLLPLYLTNMESYDAALTLAPCDGFYVGATILPLNYAYTNARVIGRPSAHWLLELLAENGGGWWNEPRFEYGEMPYR